MLKKACSRCYLKICGQVIVLSFDWVTVVPGVPNAAHDSDAPLGNAILPTPPVPSSGPFVIAPLNPTP